MIRKLFILAAPFILAACSDNDGSTPATGKGKLSFRTGIDVSTELVPTRAGIPLDDFTGYKVTLKGAGTKTIDMPSDGVVDGIDAGTYSVTLSNDTGFVPAFEAPRYSATEAGVAVEAGKNTDVEMTLTQSNAGIYFIRDASLDGTGLEDAVPTVTQGDDALVFEGNDAERKGYFNVGEAVMTLALDGKPLPIGVADSKTIEFEAGQLWEVTLKLKPGTGGLGITASIEVVTEPNKSEEILIDPPTLPAPKIGDYYYSDGTWSDGGLVSIGEHGLNPVWAAEKPAPLAGKTVIGIVFQTNPDRMAQAEKDLGYTKGYVMAVKNAHPSDEATVMWSQDWDFSCLKAAKSAAVWYDHLKGYEDTMTVKETYGNDIATWMPAFHYTLNDFSLTAPASSSGWFLPSTGQVWDMLANLCGHEVAEYMKGWQTKSSSVLINPCDENASYDVIAKFHESMSKIAPADKEEFGILSDYRKTTTIWASTPFDDETACVFYIGTNGKIELYQEFYDYEAYARPILAF